MITAETSRDVETGGLMETNQFTILANGKAFKVLIDGLYSNKIRAVIRELCSNAFDGQVEAGRGYLSFQVHLPTRFDPSFKVRDFGVSLSHKDVMGLYTTVFQSTKTGTNAQVGKLGLGSKSPFAYTDAFTVVARLDGEKRTYSAFIGSDGVPSIALFTTEKTIEDDGLEVGFPVAAKDVDAFATNAREVLQWFPVKPKLTGAPIIFNDPVVALEGAGWKLFNNNGGTVATAIQGVVGYPLDHNAIPDITTVEKSILKSRIHIQFPIGSLEIAASREGLSYDVPTVKAIKTRLAQIASEITKHYTAEISQQSTFWDACLVFTRVVSSSALPEVVREALVAGTTWQGRKLTTSVSLQNVITHVHPDYWCGVHYLGHKEVRRKHLRTSAMTNRTYNVHAHVTPTTKFYVVSADVKQYMRKIQDHAAKSVTNSMVIILAPRDVAATILAQFGDPPHTFVEDLPEIVRAPRVSATSERTPTVKAKKDQIKVRAMSMRSGLVSKLLDVRDLSEGGYYLAVTDGRYAFNVNQYGYGINTKADTNGHSAVFSQISKAKNVGCFPAVDTVYLVSAPHLGKVEASDKWINLLTEIDTLAKAKHAEWLAAASILNKQEILDGFSTSALFKSELKPASRFSPLYALQKVYEEVRSSLKFSYHSPQRYDIISLSIFSEEQSEFRKEFTTLLSGKVRDPSLEMLNKSVEERYPLLTVLNGRSLHDNMAAIQDYIDMCDAAYEGRSNQQRSAA